MAILGFYGASPDAEIWLQRLDIPALLTFAFTGGRSEGSMMLKFDIVDPRPGRVVASTGEQVFYADGSPSTFLAPALMAIYGHEGPFEIHCLMDGAVQYIGYFRVRQAVAV